MEAGREQGLKGEKMDGERWTSSEWVMENEQESREWKSEGREHSLKWYCSIYTVYSSGLTVCSPFQQSQNNRSYLFNLHICIVHFWHVGSMSLLFSDLYQQRLTNDAVKKVDLKSVSSSSLRFDDH